MALVPQVVDAVKVPVIAAGGIGDGRGVAAALALGAAGAQIGTAFLLTPEAKTVGAASRRAEDRPSDDSTTLTNLFTGRPARGHRQSLHPRSRPDQRRRAGLSAGGRPPPTAAGRRRGQGLDRFHAAVERTGAVAGARDAVGRADRRPGERDRGGAQARAGMTASSSWSTKPRVIGAWPISRR